MYCRCVAYFAPVSIVIVYICVTCSFVNSARAVYLSDVISLNIRSICYCVFYLMSFYAAFSIREATQIIGPRGVSRLCDAYSTGSPPGKSDYVICATSKGRSSSHSNRSSFEYCPVKWSRFQSPASSQRFL